MQISRDTPKTTNKLYLELMRTLITQAQIDISERPIISLLKRDVPVTQYPWSTFAKLENRIFSQHFCHIDSFTVKGEGKSKHGCLVKLKQMCDYNNNSMYFSTQFNIRIPLDFKNEETALDCRITNTDIKVVYNHELKEFKGMKLYFHEAFGHTRMSKNTNFKFGLAAAWNHFGIDNRIKVDQDMSVVLYHKILAQKDKFQFGMMGVFDLSKRFIASKLLFGSYKDKNLEIYLKADQAYNKRTQDYRDFKQWFSHLSSTAVYRLSGDVRIALQTTFRTKQNNFLTSMLLQYRKNYKNNQSTLYKFKLNSLLTLSFLARHQYNNKFIFSLGCNFPFYDKIQRSKVGVRIDINM